MQEPLNGYREISGPGLIARARARWRDPATWRDAAYLIGLWVPLFILDTTVLAVWLTFLAGVTLPKALLAAACFLVLFLIFNYVVVPTARAHTAVARSVLRAPADPLAPAKEVLAGPGPLGPLQHSSR